MIDPLFRIFWSLFSVCLEPPEHHRHARHRPRLRVEQGAADELDVIRVDHNAVGDTLEPRSLDRNAAVARTVGQLIEQVRQVGGGRFGQTAENAGVLGHELQTTLDLRSPLAGQKSAIAGQDMVSNSLAPHAGD